MDQISYIGIDPGLTGGISIFNVELRGEIIAGITLIESLRMPVVNSNRLKSKVTKRIDVLELDCLIHNYNVTHGAIELVSARPSRDASGKTVQGASSTFTFGYGTGMTEGVCLLNDIDLTWITARVWKGKAGLVTGASKMDSVNLAASMWPMHEFNRLVDNGRAEAALIGLHGIIHHIGGTT